MNFSRSLILAAALGTFGSAQAGWNRSPYAEERPVDLAASAIPGTKLVSSSGLKDAQSLVDSKVSGAVAIPPGKSSAVIQLSSQQNVHTAAFNNDGAEGRVSVAGSPDNKEWSVLGSAVFSARDRVAQIYFAAATVKYLTVSFDSAKGGTIRSFGVYGDSSDRDFAVLPTNEGEVGATINLAGAMSGARAIYAFPTPTGVGELNALHNVFKFPMSRDKHCTIVYELGSTRAVRDFAVSYSQRPMRVEVLAFDGLIEKRDWRGKLTLDPAVLSSAKPVAVGEDAKGLGHMRITPDKAVSASYIALRFEPDYQTGVAASGLLPESRFAKSQLAGNELVVGAVEFLSDREYQVIRSNAARTPEPTPLMLGGRAGMVDPYISAAFGSSASTLHRSLPGQAAQTLNADRGTKTDAARNAGDDSKTKTPGTAVASSASAPAPSAAPYVPGEAGSPESKLVKSFSNKFDAGASKKNKHGRHCDHCYYCNRGGRCHHCGGHDDDHDSDHDGHDDNDHGGDHGDHGGDHGDHDDHQPPVTSC